MSSTPNTAQRPAFGITLVFVLLAAAAWLAVRTPELNNRPMHGDEAVNAYRVGTLLNNGVYKYDPTEHHGPTLIYAAAAVAKAFGTHNLLESSETQIRLTTVIAGLALVLVLPLLADALGWWAVWLAALFLVIDPAIAFYSRYYIHETMLIASSALALAAGWRLSRSGGGWWAAAFGAALALMFATKTTAVLMYAAAGLALTPQIWRQVRRAGVKSAVETIRWPIVLIAGGCFVLTWAMLYSSFFSHPRGLWDSIAAFGYYFTRGLGGNPEAADHLHPWYYHLKRLVYIRDDRGFIWSQAFVMLLAAIGVFRGQPSSAPLRRFLALYAVIQIALYSVIPYKTPWLTLGAWYAVVILAGCGAAALLRVRGHVIWRILAVLFVASTGTYQAAQTWRACYQYPAHPRNPFIYGQTSPDFLRLVQRIRDLAPLTPGDKAEFIGVYTTFPWPLPWYLRDFSKVGYWQEIPESLLSQPPQIFVISPELADTLPDDFYERYMFEYYGQYHSAHLMLAIENSLWDTFMARRNAAIEAKHKP